MAKSIVTKVINYLMPKTLKYKFKSKFCNYMVIVLLCLLPILGVYFAEITWQLSKTEYWLYHVVFGFWGAWFFGFMGFAYGHPHSFRLGVAITIMVSLGNEYFYDVLDYGEQWVFSDQLVHTIADFVGISVSCFVHRLVKE